MCDMLELLLLFSILLLLVCRTLSDMVVALLEYYT